MSFVLCAVLTVALFAACSATDRPLSVAELLDLGEKYLLELNYEQALVQFLKVIEIEPMNPRGYTGAAEAYIGLGQPEEAIAILQQGLEVVSPEDTEALTEMISEVEADPSLEGVASPSPEPTPDISLETTPEPLPDWRPLYREFLTEFYNEALATEWTWDFDSGYTVSLLDLTLNGIPELIIDWYGHNSTSRTIYYYSDSEVKRLEYDNYGRLLLIRNRHTHELSFACISELYVDHLGSWIPGHLGEFSMENGIPNYTQLLFIQASDDVPWDYRHNNEAQTLSEIPQYFVGTSLMQGASTSITAQQFMEMKDNYFSQHEVVIDYHRDGYINPCRIDYTSPVPNISIDEFFALWDQNPQPNLG
jgi:tetratricopeptide (TPR) repeat protein